MLTDWLFSYHVIDTRLIFVWHGSPHYVIKLWFLQTSCDELWWKCYFPKVYCS